jgi:hypothetical protein
MRCNALHLKEALDGFVLLGVGKVRARVPGDVALRRAEGLGPPLLDRDEVAFPHANAHLPIARAALVPATPQSRRSRSNSSSTSPSPSPSPSVNVLKPPLHTHAFPPTGSALRATKRALITEKSALKSPTTAQLPTCGGAPALTLPGCCEGC